MYVPLVASLLNKMIYIDYILINQARGPFWENIGSRSLQHELSAARFVLKGPRGDILQIRVPSKVG